MNKCFSPRVVNPNRADFYSIETFLAYHKFKNKSNEDLILAIYDYLTSTDNGSYHFWDIEEKKGVPNIRGVVVDPVKNFNVYGWFICGQMSFCLYRIYTTAGYKARQFGLPGHSVAEVYYDNGWHFFDVDMWVWCRAKEGHIASAVELSKNPEELIVSSKNKSNPCNLPDRTLNGYAQMFKDLKTKDNDLTSVWADCSSQYHTMDFVLRPGESLLRTPMEQGFWHLPNRFLPNIKKYGGEWKNKPCERYKPFRTYGNKKHCEVMWKIELPYLASYLRISTAFDISGGDKIGIFVSPDAGKTRRSLYWGSGHPPKLVSLLPEDANSIKNTQELWVGMDMSSLSANSTLRLRGLEINIGYQVNMNLMPRLLPGQNELYLEAEEISKDVKLVASWAYTHPDDEMIDTIELTDSGKKTLKKELKIKNPYDIVMRGVTIKCLPK